MWRRALLAAAALSYIICVLIMSGMQKEDLDVSMLRKLQRYNVNIDRINNEELRQQCFSENNGFKTDIKKDKTNVSTTEQNKSTITTEIPLPVSLNMDTILNYLNRRHSDSDLDETITIKTTSVQQDRSTDKSTTTAELLEHQPKVDMSLLRRYIELETQKKSIYKRDDNSESTKVAGTINFKTNEINPAAIQNNAYIEKLLNNYIFHKQAVHTTTTTEPTTKLTLDIQSIYKKIDEILATNSNDEITERKGVVKVTDTSGTNHPRQLVKDSVSFLPLNQNSSYLEGNRLLKSFYNFLGEMNQLRNDSWPSNPARPNQAQPYKLAEPFIQNQQKIYKETTTYKSKPENEPNQKALTPNLVKEIAETVKDVIIKDLRNELSDIYLKTTHSTTKSTPTIKATTKIIFQTRPPKNITQEGNTSIMDKFMELYEEMKSLKQATFSLKPKNESENLVHELKQEIKFPGQNTLFMPIVKRLQIPETQIFFSSKGKYNARQSYNQDPYVPRKDNSHAVPITIQTNSVEIQPLAVPISKPQSLIRQNIIVNSVHRLPSHHPMKFTVRNRYPAHATQKNQTYNHTPMKTHERYDSQRYPIHVSSLEPKHREDIIRFRMRDNGNSRFDTDYYEKINFENDQARPYAKQVSYNNRYIPRFHEKLERTDAGSDGIPFITSNDNTDKQEQENNMDVPSRQQLSLVDMKKGSTYNDTHFKNFLKTQQKVTDMLERILATRSKTNTPRSVETV